MEPSMIALNEDWAGVGGVVSQRVDRLGNRIDEKLKLLQQEAKRRDDAMNKRLRSLEDAHNAASSSLKQANQAQQEQLRRIEELLSRSLTS